MSKKIINKFNMFSSYNKYEKNRDVVGVKEQIHYDDGSIESAMKYYDNPKRKVYITKPEFRDYKFKPELEHVSRLNEYHVNEHNKLYSISNLMGGYSKGFVRQNTLFKSPYIFGADISIEALMKRAYNSRTTTEAKPITSFFDIETTETEDRTIMLASYMIGDTVHCFVLKSYLWKLLPNNKDRVRVTPDDVVAKVPAILENYLSRHKFSINFDLPKFEYKFHFHDTEKSLIIDIFKTIHFYKADLCGIWNMGFDIPVIIKRIEECTKLDASLFFCGPDCPPKYRFLKYKKDENPKVTNIALLWDWVSSNCPTQFVNSLGIYAQLRRTSPFPASFALEYILNMTINCGKLPLVNNSSHAVMQKMYFTEYIAYNIFDVVSMSIMERKNNDLINYSVQSGDTPISQFNLSTIKSTNKLFFYHVDKGNILSSKSKLDDYNLIDQHFSRAGGTVLDPNKYVGPNIRLS